MEVTCPACGKTVTGDNECSRCGCNTAILASIMHAARRECRAALKCLTVKDIRGARKHAATSWRLHHTTVAARYLYISAIDERDWAAASKWYGRANTLFREKQSPY